MSTTLVAFDLETTGTEPLEHEAIEIGAAQLDSEGNPTGNTFGVRLQIKNPGAIEPGVLGVFNHYSEAAWCDALSQREGWKKFQVWLDALPAPAVFLGSSVAKFDLQFLLQAERRQCLSFRFERHTVDISAVFRAVATALRIPTEGYGLMNASEALGLKYESHHNALEDALQAAKVYRECLTRIQA